MLHLTLAIVIFHADIVGAQVRPIAGRLHPARVGHIAGLDHMHAKPAVELHRIVKLGFVIGDVAAGFVMADQLDMLLAA
jgi:hypothetical protein